MALTKITNLLDNQVTVFNAVAGTPTGTSIYANSPVRGRIIEAGFVPSEAVTSAMTLSVLTNDIGVSSTASNFVECITSTLGTFSSTNLFQGATASVVPPNPSSCYVNPGDVIKFTSSGGNSSTVGAMFYAIIRKG